VTGLALGGLVGAMSGLALVVLMRPQVMRHHRQVSGPPLRSGSGGPAFDPGAARTVWSGASPRR